MVKKVKQLNEFQADHSPNQAIEPVDTGNAHANRSADAGPSGEESVLFTPGSDAGFGAVANATRSQVIAQVVDKMLSLKQDELVSVFTRLFGNSDNPADQVNAQGYNLGTMKGNPGAVQPALDNGSINYAAQVNAAAGDTSVKGVDALPAADPSGLAKMAAEEVEAILKGETLSEDAKTKISTLFESAVNTQVKLVEAQLTDEFQTRLEEGVEEAIETIVEQVDLYVSEAAKQFMTENKLAAVDTARLALNENFIRKFKGLLEEVNIEVSEEDVNIAESALAQTQIAEAAATEALTKVKGLENQLVEAQKALVLEKAGSSLTLENREKLKTLSESVAYVSADDFAAKVQVLKEQRLNVPASKAADVNGNDANRIGYLEESTETPSGDRTAAGIAAGMTAFLAKSKLPV